MTGAYFCGGSLPELLATAVLLGENDDCANTLEAVVVDKFADTWAWTYPICTGLAKMFAPSVDVSLGASQEDLTQGLGAETLATVSRADLVFFQHCLNEFVGNDQAMNQIEAIGRAAHDGAIFVFLDQGYYRSVTNAMRAKFFLPDPPLKHGFFDGVPQADGQGGWLPGQYRASSLNLRALIMRKTH